MASEKAFMSPIMKTGRSQVKESYKNDLREGIHIAYHENGQLSAQNCKNDAREGIWIWYHENSRQLSSRELQE